MADTEQQQAPTPAAPPLTHAEVAKSVFGKDYYGEVGKAEPKEKAPPPDDIKEGAEPVEEEPAEGEPGETGEPEEAERTASEGAGETPIATVSELMEHLDGADPEWFNTLKVPVHVDGTPTEATIGDLIKSYQMTEAATNRLEDAKKYAQANTEAWAAKQQELDSQFQVLAELIQAEEQTLERDVKAVDPALRDSDPAEWAARVTEFGHRRGHIEQMKANAIAKHRANAEARTKEAETWKANVQKEQNDILLQKLPEWREPQKAETEKVQIADYLIRQGFTQADLSNLLDHRQVLMARKAMLYDQSRGKVDTAKKRVASVPRIMKPGAPKPTEQLASDKLQKLRSRLENSGSIEDAVAYRMAKRGARR